MIKQRTLGRTGLKISELCLGTLNFGWKTDETNSFAILDAYHAAGGNFIQTAVHPAEFPLPAASANASEELVGRWWRSRGLSRDQLFMATRIQVRSWHADVGAFGEWIRQECHASMQRLKTNYIDMVIFEWGEGLLPIGQTLKAFDQIVRTGLTRFIGSANFPAWRVSDSLARAHLGNHSRMEALQADYSLMTRARFEPEVMSLCLEQRLGFFARSPLAGGFLIGRNARNDVFSSTRRRWLTERFANAYGDAALAAVRNVASRHEVSSGQVALAWVLHNPAVTSAIIGVGSVAQLNQLVRATDLGLEKRDLLQLNHATEAEVIQLGGGFAHGRPARAPGIRISSALVNGSA